MSTAEIPTVDPRLLSTLLRALLRSRFWRRERGDTFYTHGRCKNYRDVIRTLEKREARQCG